MVPFPNHKKAIVNSGSWYLKFILIHFFVSSAGFGSLLSQFTYQRNFPSRMSRNIWNFLVLTIAYCIFLFLSLCVMWKNNVLIYYTFLHLNRGVWTVAPSVKFISSNHSSSFFITFIQTVLNNTISNNESEKTYVILQGVIDVTGRKHAQNKFNRENNYERWKTQQSTEKNWHIILMFQESSPCIWTNSGNPMTIINFLALIRACGAI